MRITSTWRSASRSERRHGILLGSLLGTLSLAVALGTARAQGAVVGQVNALSVFDLGDVAFGRPSRITCVVAAGSGTINSVFKRVNNE